MQSDCHRHIKIRHSARRLRKSQEECCKCKLQREFQELNCLERPIEFWVFGLLSSLVIRHSDFNHHPWLHRAVIGMLLYWSLGRTLAQKLDYTNALLTLRTAKTKTGGEWPGIDGEIGYVHARQGATNQARQIIAELPERESTEYVDPYIYAMIYAGFGEAGKVFEHLNLACDKRTP